MPMNFPNSPTVGDNYTVGDKTWTWNGTSWDVVIDSNGVAIIRDADNDTKIQVEESADEDIIRFDTAGTERMTISATGAVTVNETLTATNGIITLTSAGAPAAALADGAIAVDTSNDTFYYRSNSTWQEVSGTTITSSTTDAALITMEIG